MTQIIKLYLVGRRELSAAEIVHVSRFASLLGGVSLDSFRERETNIRQLNSSFRRVLDVSGLLQLARNKRSKSLGVGTLDFVHDALWWIE